MCWSHLAWVAESQPRPIMWQGGGGTCLVARHLKNSPATRVYGDKWAKPHHWWRGTPPLAPPLGVVYKLESMRLLISGSDRVQLLARVQLAAELSMLN